MKEPFSLLIYGPNIVIFDKKTSVHTTEFVKCAGYVIYLFTNNCIFLEQTFYHNHNNIKQYIGFIIKKKKKLTRIRNVVDARVSVEAGPPRFHGDHLLTFAPLSFPQTPPFWDAFPWKENKEEVRVMVLVNFADKGFEIHD